MHKDFDRWNKKKKMIHSVKQGPFFHEREIWFCYLGANVGFEQDGAEEDFLRPVIVVRKFNNEIFWAVPLTKVKKKIPKRLQKYYFSFSFIDGVESAAILSQIRLTDSKRLGRLVGYIKEKEYRDLMKKLKELIP